MKRKIGLLITAVLLVAVAVAAWLREPDTYELLKHEWQFVSQTSQSQSSSKLSPEQNKLHLTPDFIFWQKMAGQPDTLRGVWRYRNNQLILTIDYTRIIDSLAYVNNQNNPQLVLFSDNEETSAISASGLQNRQLVKAYSVTKCTSDSLWISNDSEGFILISSSGGRDALLTETPPLQFSFTAILRGLLGMAVLIGIAYLFSSNRKAVSWRVVGTGLLIQLILAFSILKISFVASSFEFVGKIFVKVLDFTKDGSTFLMGNLMDANSYGFIFAFQVLPTIIFFSALTSVLFYLGIIQKVVYVLAWLMTKALKLSGAESLSVAGNIFLGQTESPLLIKAYLEKMNRSEILLVMAGGMATLAGGVLAAYIAFLGGSDPVQRLFFAKHLLTASIMAAPGVVVIAKVLIPQDQEINSEVEVSKDKIGSNILDAISNGTTEGIKLAVNVAGMLLVFIALIALINFVLSKLGGWTGFNSTLADLSNGQYSVLNLEAILGYLFAPLVWVLGVTKEDITLVGRVVGEKLILTEFIGYVSLANLKEAGLFAEQKSIVMATYMLCGFANFASIGIQIGGIGALAPGKRVLLSELGMRALLAGTLASLLSATIVGMVLG